ncbi:MAG TPA: hypothetical protein VGF22_16735 [Acidimicrobiales bacterium]|jgi:hypothetical protein
MVRVRIPLATALAGVLVLAACGSDNSSGSSATSAAATSAAATSAAATTAGATTTAAGGASTTAAGGASTTAGASGTSGPNAAGINWDMAAANAKLKEAIGDYPTVSGNTTQGVTANSVDLACVAAETTTGGVPTVQKGWCQGAKARLDNANKAKEIPLTINLVSTTDTGSDPQKEQTDLTDAISNKKVFGLMFVAAGALQSNPMETGHIPYFGDFFDCGKKTQFGYNVGYGILACAALPAETNGGWTVYTDSIMQAYTKPKGTPISSVKYAGVGTSVPAIVAYQKVLVEQLKAQGVQVVYTGNTLPPTSGEAVDLNPYVVPVIDSNPDVTGIFSGDPQLTARLYGAMKDAGYKGDALAAFTSSQLQNPATAQLVDNGLATSAGWGFPGYGGKYWDAVSADATAVGAPVPVTQAFFHGWLAADQFVTGMKDFLKSGKQVTSENFANFLNQGWAWPGFGNVAAPTIYPYGKYNVAPCATIARESAAQKKELPYQDLTCGTVFIQKISS